MLEEYQDRMVDTPHKRKRGRPPKHQPVPQVVVEVQQRQDVVRCPRCGCARPNQWERSSTSATGDPYWNCRACGSRYAFLSNGTMRQIC